MMEMRSPGTVQTEVTDKRQEREAPDITEYQCFNEKGALNETGLS